MAKILMMTGSAVVVLSLLGFLVLFLKERATGKTSPVLQGEPAEFGKNRTLRFSGHP